MDNTIENVYSKPKAVANVETGELITATEIVGEKIAKKYCTYGTCYKTIYAEIIKYDPMATLHVFNHLMLTSEPNTNRVNTSNADLQESTHQSKRTITRCLTVLRKSHILVKHEGDEYINPLVWFQGDAQHRLGIFLMLGKPTVIISDAFYRKEYRIVKE